MVYVWEGCHRRAGASFAAVRPGNNIELCVSYAPATLLPWGQVEWSVTTLRFQGFTLNCISFVLGWRKAPTMWINLMRLHKHLMDCSAVGIFFICFGFNVFPSLLWYLDMYSLAYCIYRDLEASQCVSQHGKNISNVMSIVDWCHNRPFFFTWGNLTFLKYGC